MPDTLSIFKSVSVIFALASMATGVMAITDPLSFSKQFGLPLDSSMSEYENTPETSSTARHDDRAFEYASLMGIRQLSIGLIILLFAYQDKWIEIATILAIIGVIVAGTDGIYITRGGSRKAGMRHALPGALIAALAGQVLYSNA